jgi:hypothetical protein
MNFNPSPLERGEALIILQNCVTCNYFIYNYHAAKKFHKNRFISWINHIGDRCL